MTHRELGAKILQRLTGDLSDIADVEVAPKMEGYQMFTIFLPKKGKADVKKAQHVSTPSNGEPERKKEKAERVKRDEEKKPARDDEDDIF
jgi:hypothetical protein